jgi:hypothetical protein
LDGCGIDEKVDRGVATAADLDDIAQCRPVQAGDDADAAGELRERAGVVEEALTAEAGFELLHGGEQSAEAGLLHGFSDELELAAGVVDGELAPQADGVAVFGPEAEELGLAAEEDDGELRVAVLEREVAVAAGCRTPVGDLAFDRDLRVGALDERAEGTDELADGEDVGLWSRDKG